MRLSQLVKRRSLLCEVVSQLTNRVNKQRNFHLVRPLPNLWPTSKSLCQLAQRLYYYNNNIKLTDFPNYKFKASWKNPSLDKPVT